MRSWKPATEPLCIHSQRSYRNGWQLLRCTGVPVEARMCANISGVLIWAATSRRLRSFHAGSTLLNTAGTDPSPYHPMPKPSPFVVVAPIRECRLWSISECCGRNSRSSARSGSPEYAIHLHMPPPNQQAIGVGIIRRG